MKPSYRAMCAEEAEVFLAASIPMAFRAEAHARQEQRARTPRRMCRATEAAAVAPVAATVSWIAARSVTTVMVMIVTVAGEIAPSAGNPVPDVTPVILRAVIRQQ